ncbi:Imm26 family immunity protein [Paraburkholderia dilworthii]|uniref:Imm26 family immunity protein n=1 Tax=Paraburkholderia dilworthii TaxID=948106 RepID=UPI0004187323|nr:Imm26 family immunity protein [Paraburkholderia dilworthii]
MPKKSSPYPIGTFLRIPLADGTFGYGRALDYSYIAFYDFRTTDPRADLGEIESKPVLFIQSVRQLDPQRWAALGKRPLSGEVAKPVVRYRQDLVDFRKCTIYDSEGMTREATPEECIGLEGASTWDKQHIEARILDHYMGRPNDMEIRGRVRLE